MVDTISKRRTHYEVLGLTPGATGEEIEQAFARQFGCFEPQTVGRLADVTVAYETLRNPAKRRAYDASLGLEPKETPQPSPVTWRIGGQVMTATATPAMRPAVQRPKFERPTPYESQVELESVPPPRPATPFIAAALRDLASPEPLRERLESRAKPAAKIGTEPPRSPEAESNRAPRAAEERRIDLALTDVPENTEDGRIPWKQAGIVAGTLAAGVALLGAWAGWESVSSAEPAENATKAVLPPPTTYTVSDPAAAVPDRVLDVARPPPVRRPAHDSTPTVRPRRTSRLADLDRQRSQPEVTPGEMAPAAVARVEAAATVAASLPLPNRVIARTIERIGYPCGQIASTTQSQAPGVFKVTCTSGHSYQAAPVSGRYHFRRLAGG
jgi:hypothetical protein